MAGHEFKVVKTLTDQNLVFGWASVAISKEGKTIQDYEEDQVDMEAMEPVMYEFVQKYRAANVSHQGPQIGDLVECTVFTKQKMAAMGIPEGTVPEGVWIGFKVDDATFAKVKKHELEMFSIEGKGIRIPLAGGE